MSGSVDDESITLVRQCFSLRHLQRLRRLVARAAGWAGLDSQRGQQLVLAVNEAVSNVIRHGGGRGRLKLTRDDRRALVVEISDDGPGMPSDPALAAPPAEQPGGRGLYLIKRLCDRVEFRTGPAGTTVRLEMNLHTG